MSTTVRSTAGHRNLASFNASRRNQQPRNTSRPSGTGVELHPCTKDGMIPFAKSNTNLPMHARKETTMLHFSSARSSESKSTHYRGYVNEARTRKERNPNHSCGTPIMRAGRNQELTALHSRAETQTKQEANMTTHDHTLLR
jgi:hypothetical protein